MAADETQVPPHEAVRRPSGDDDVGLVVGGGDVEEDARNGIDALDRGKLLPTGSGTELESMLKPPRWAAIRSPPGSSMPLAKLCWAPCVMPVIAMKAAMATATPRIVRLDLTGWPARLRIASLGDVHCGFFTIATVARRASLSSCGPSRATLPSMISTSRSQ